MGSHQSFMIIIIVDTITDVPAFLPFAHLHPPPPSSHPLPSGHPTLLSVSVVTHTCSLADPFTFFPPAPHQWFLSRRVPWSELNFWKAVLIDVVGNPTAAQPSPKSGRVRGMVRSRGPSP